MMAFSRRQKLIGGSLCITIGAWAFDMLGGGSTPTEAGATPSVATAEQSPETQNVMGRAQAVLALLESQKAEETRLRRRTPVGRDLFAMTGPAWAALLTPEPLPEPEPAVELQANAAPENEPETEVQASFADTHVLRGVVAGRTPLALVNEAVVSPGAVIDGYRVLEIRRDHACFSGAEGVVTLWVARPLLGASSRTSDMDEAAPKNKTPAQIKSLADLADFMSGK